MKYVYFYTELRPLIHDGSTLGPANNEFGYNGRLVVKKIFLLRKFLPLRLMLKNSWAEMITTYNELINICECNCML